MPANAAGKFKMVVTIPAAMAAGKHTVRAMTGSVVVASLPSP